MLNPVIRPPTSDIGYSTVLSVVAFGGGPGSYAYTWNGLPDCPGGDSPTLACVPGSPASSGAEISVTVRDSGGVQVRSGTSVWYVNPRPTVTQISVLPSPLSVGSNLVVSVSFLGGTAPWLLQYSGLPAGCPMSSSTNSDQPVVFTCSAQAPGSYTPRVVVTDADGENATAATILSVTGSTGQSSPLWEYVVEVTLILVGALILILLARREMQKRGGRPDAPPPSPPAPESPGVRPGPVHPAKDASPAPITGDPEPEPSR